MADGSAAAPHAVMMDLLTGYWRAQAVNVAAELGLADLLRDGPRTPAQLAEATGTHAHALYRLLRALASLGVFAEDEQGRFALTPLAETLRGDVPGSLRAVAVMMGGEHYRSWAELLYCVQTGQTAFEKLYGEGVFAYLAAHPQAARTFDAAMVGIHGRETAAMLDAYDFAGLGTLVDVGGGNGSLLTAALHRHPKLRGILYDRPDVVERARPALKAAGLEERCQAVGGNFFEAVPAGGDAYLMRHIIHDWYDDQCLTLLRNCRKAMTPDGKLLLIEAVIPPSNGPFSSKFLDLNMLVIPGGMERSEREYRELLAAAGFRLARVVPTATEVSVIEGVPA
jgi:hypothetical protein